VQFEEENIPDPPFTVPSGRNGTSFIVDYQLEKLWTYSADQITSDRMEPLLPLPRGVTKEMLMAARLRLDELAGQPDASPPTEEAPVGEPYLNFHDWLTLGMIFNFFVSPMIEGWTRLIGENRALIDALKETPLYHELLNYAVDEARKEGLEQGRAAGLREAVVEIVRAMFPTLVMAADGKVATMTSEQELDALLIQLARAHGDVARAAALLAG